MIIRTRKKRKKIRIPRVKRRKPVARQRKVRLAIECTPEERKYMKMLAAHEETTLNELVLESVKMRFEKCPFSHVPNKTTRKAMEDAEKGKTMKAKDFDDLCKQLGI